MLCDCGCGLEVSKGKHYRKGHGRRGKRNSPEHNAKIAKANAGKPRGTSWNKGLKGDPRCAVKSGARKKSSETWLAKIASGYIPDTSGLRTPWTKEKCVQALIGHEVSSETRSKIGAANAGERNGMWGKTHSEEAKRAISEASKRAWSTKTTRAKIENSLRSPENVERSRERAYAQSWGFTSSKPENAVADLLVRAGVRFDRWAVLVGPWGKFACDFLLPEKVVLEVDGVWWHSFPWGRPIDRTRTEKLLSAGYLVRRLWEHEVGSLSPEGLLKFLRTGWKPKVPLTNKWLGALRRACRNAIQKGHHNRRPLHCIWKGCRSD